MSKGNVARAGQPRRVAAVNFFLSKARCIVEKIQTLAIAGDFKYFEREEDIVIALNRSLAVKREKNRREREREDALRERGVAVIHVKDWRWFAEAQDAIRSSREGIVGRYKKSAWRVKALARVIVDERVDTTTRHDAVRFLFNATLDGVDISIAARELSRAQDCDIVIRSYVVDALVETMRIGSDETKKRIADAIPNIEMLMRESEEKYKKMEERLERIQKLF